MYAFPITYTAEMYWITALKILTIVAQGNSSTSVDNQQMDMAVGEDRQVASRWTDQIRVTPYEQWVAGLEVKLHPLTYGRMLIGSDGIYFSIFGQKKRIGF